MATRECIKSLDSLKSIAKVFIIKCINLINKIVANFPTKMVGAYIKSKERNKLLACPL